MLFDPKVAMAFCGVAYFMLTGIPGAFIPDLQTGVHCWDELIDCLANWISRQMSMRLVYRERLVALYRGDGVPATDDLETAALIEYLRETLWAKP